ncbi:hypothetical protein NEOLEDRAFT_1133472 [Neolentinus lepideus HHB14362 ss-1]|uniref:Uncharacterized protein n=1 Tax=Neolentinus lepideus HHB14362 ss-1 TaxID=1314782 RepID=A0A165SQE7_9AGAM|nr:hypothetical protein NEOLEDRAFT_1133472 [Neolentinus lepideus HHB14362 ss-1]
MQTRLPLTGFTPPEGMVRDSDHYVNSIRQLLQDIGYSYEPPFPVDEGFNMIFHEWTTNRLQPIMACSAEQVAGIADMDSHSSIRYYPRRRHVRSDGHVLRLTEFDKQVGASETEVDTEEDADRAMD